MNNAIATTQNNELTMTSLEIADYTGKRHDNVTPDIKKMLIELELDVLSFQGIYKDGLNRKQTMYVLNRELTDCLLTGYSAKARMKVIKRWHELEAESQFKIPTTMHAALQLAADQALQLELAAPKVAFVDNLVDQTGLMTATQVAQKHGMSAVKLNRILDEMGGVYSKSVKRSRVFLSSFESKGYGVLKQTEQGHDQALFTNAGEAWINEQLIKRAAK